MVFRLFNPERKKYLCGLTFDIGRNPGDFKIGNNTEVYCITFMFINEPKSIEFGTFVWGFTMDVMDNDSEDNLTFHGIRSKSELDELVREYPILLPLFQFNRLAYETNTWKNPTAQEYLRDIILYEGRLFRLHPLARIYNDRKL